MKKNRPMIVGASPLLALALGLAGSGCGKLRESRAENLRDSAIEHFTKGDREKALEISEIAIRLGADGADLRGMRGSILLMKKKPEKALSEFDEAIALAEVDPKAPVILSPRLSLMLKDLYISRGSALQVTGRYEEALASYEKAIEADETEAWAHNNIAWLLATGPDETIRDGERAIEFATRACELGEWENSACLDTLAAAYAEAGDFENAVKWQEKAMKDVESWNEKEQAGFAERLRLYSQKKVYREDPREKYLDEG